jgi:hypothetical protein
VVTNSFRAARDAITGDSWLDDLARASLSAAEEKFAQDPRVTPTLRVSIPGIHDLDARASYVLTKAVQDATAKIGHIIHDPRSEAASVYASDRRRARLIQRGQSGGMILFGFPTDASLQSANIIDPSLRHIETLAERAARELVTVLPRSDDDDASVDAVLAQRPTVRNAVNDIANAVPNETEGLDFQLTRTTGEVIDSVLSAEQAVVLKSSLSGVSREVQTVSMVGRLDGVRTRRRIFYLELDSGKDIHGAIDLEQLEDVRRNLDKQVVTVLQEERVISITGRRSRPYYRLISIESPQEIF